MRVAGTELRSLASIERSARSASLIGVVGAIRRTAWLPWRFST